MAKLTGKEFEALVQEIANDYSWDEINFMSKNPMKYVNPDAIEAEFWPSILREAEIVKRHMPY